MRQKSILLALVETVHLVDKHNGALRLQAIAGVLGQLDGFTNLFDATEHGTDADELSVEGVRHQASDGGFTHPGRSPQNAAVRLPRLEGHPQGHAWAQDVLLPDDVAQLSGSKLLGQGDVGRLHGLNTW